MKSTAALQFKTSGGGRGGVKSHARKDQATVGVDMAVVHSTSRIDLETRWLVQWQGERVHPIAVSFYRQEARKLLNARVGGLYLCFRLTLGVCSPFFSIA